jgi:hypothetical protein
MIKCNKMLLKVALNTITLTLTKNIAIFSLYFGLYFKDNIPYNDYFETAWVCYTLYLLNGIQTHNFSGGRH